MGENAEVREAIIERLSRVIDSETGVDVVRMRLIEDLVVHADGRVGYKFRPSSLLCPLAVPLAQMIQAAVAEVPGVVEQEMQIVGYIQAVELETLLRQIGKAMK